MSKQVVEHGNLYFFYRPKVHEERVRDLDDVERFYMVMVPDEPKKEFRLLIVGQKQLPEILPGRMAPSERNWAIVDYVTENAQILLLGARKQNIEEALGIEFKKETAEQAVEKEYKALHMNKKDHPDKPLVLGQWPETKEAA